MIRGKLSMAAGGIDADAADPDYAAVLDTMVVDGRLMVPAHGIQLAMIGDEEAGQTITLQLWVNRHGLAVPLTAHAARGLAAQLVFAAERLEQPAAAAANAAIDKARGA